MKKDGHDISFILQDHHRKDGLNLSINGTQIELYRGKALLATYKTQYVTVEGLRSMATSYEREAASEQTTA